MDGNEKAEVDKIYKMTTRTETEGSPSKSEQETVTRLDSSLILLYLRFFAHSLWTPVDEKERR